MQPGNAHGAEDWRWVPAFAEPEIYELLEAEGIRYAIRLPANQVLQRRIGHLLTRPVGRPPNKPVVSTPAFTIRPDG